MTKKRGGRRGTGASAGSGDAARDFLTDFISGEQVRATPEEVQAVQVFARRLVEDYGYSKNRIRTRPQ